MVLGLPARTDLALQFACSVVVDLVGQGWKLSAGKKKVEMQTPSNEGATPAGDQAADPSGASCQARRAVEGAGGCGVCQGDGTTAAWACGLGVDLFFDAGWARLGQTADGGNAGAFGDEESGAAEVGCGPLRAGGGTGCRLPGHKAEADGYLAVFPPHVGQHLQVLARALHDATGSRCCRPLPSGHWHCRDRKLCRTALDQGRMDRLGFRRVHQEAGGEAIGSLVPMDS